MRTSVGSPFAYSRRLGASSSLGYDKGERNNLWLIFGEAKDKVRGGKINMNPGRRDGADRGRRDAVDGTPVLAKSGPDYRILTVPTAYDRENRR